jgi:16S rRNA (uracil1498-N3)-methyltransferase
VEKATELGVDQLVLLATTRGVVDPRDAKLVKLKRKSIETCKQCRRNWCMEIRGPMSLRDFLSSKQAHQVGWMLDPHGEAFANSGIPDCAVIGPEGGWTGTEIEEAKSFGWRIVSKPGHILRIETAGLAIAALSSWHASPIHGS